MASRRAHARSTADRLLHSPPSGHSFMYLLIAKHHTKASALRTVRRHGGRCVEFSRRNFGGWRVFAFFPGHAALSVPIRAVKHEIEGGA